MFCETAERFLTRILSSFFQKNLFISISNFRISPVGAAGESSSEAIKTVSKLWISEFLSGYPM